MSRKIKTRGKSEEIELRYPLNEFPRDVIEKLGGHIVYLMAVGNADIGGDTFARIYADSIGGEASSKPIGITDVTWKNCAWSLKTVKNKSPHKMKTLRLIAGRNNPGYSAGIKDYYKDKNATGQAVLDIYNQRVLEVRQKYDDMRLLVLVRNMEKLEFTLFERSLEPLAVNDYKWETNERDNFLGYKGDMHCFTWQPHGSQFTVIENVPASACRFRIDRKPSLVEMKHILDTIHFRPEWIEIQPN